MFRKKFLGSLIIALTLLTTAACQSSTALVSPTNTLVPAAQATRVSPATVSTPAAVSENNDAQLEPIVVPDASGGIAIVLNGNSIETQGPGVTVDGSSATITAAGTYALSGTLTDGQIVVDAPEDAVVTLVLNGVELNNSTTAPVHVVNAARVVIVLADGSTNVIADATEYVYPDAEIDEPDAAVFSNVALTFDGNGALTVKSNYNDGIASKAGLAINSGAITVNAVDNAIRGKDYITVNGGEITVTAGGDGLKSTNEDEADKGYIAIKNGTFNITSGGDAIQAETSLSITDGDFKLTTGGGSTVVLAEDAASATALKANTAFTLEGGTFAIDAAGDGVNTDGDIVINDGVIVMTVGDDGIHTEANMTINDGDIRINQSVEGLEAMVMTLNGGEIRLVASDDGVNIAGEVEEATGRPGQGMTEYTGVYWLYINDVYLVVSASGDGIDSNGAIEMRGGTVIVNGPTVNMEGAIDYDGTFNISGGTLVAAGSAGMPMTGSATSSQNALLVNLSSLQQAGNMINIRDSRGNAVLTFAPSKEYQSLAFSSPKLVTGETYTISLGGSATGTESDGLWQDATYTPGTDYANFTINGTVTTVGNVRMGGMGR